MKTKKKTYSFDGLPHKFPQLGKNDFQEAIIAWECQACGEWIKEYGQQEKTNCTIDWRRMYMGGRQKVMKEPPLGSIVVDIKGGAWQRSPVGWSSADGDGSWRYTWKQLLKELYEPMDYPTQKWAQVLGDPRLPCIVYIPHEELITGEEDED